MDLDELGEATRDVSAALDEIDPIPGRYTLSVSSPGLERRLRTPAHFARAVGEKVTVRVDAGTADVRRITGTLDVGRRDGVHADRPRRARTASCASPTTRSSGRGRCSSGGPSPGRRRVRG